MCHDQDAVIHIQQIMGGKTIELHLCEECAGRKGISTASQKIELSLTQLLTGLVSPGGESAAGEKEMVCGRCGTGSGELRKSGKVGCAECYSVFRKEISRMVNTGSGPLMHRGKYPRRLLTYKTFFVDRERLKQKLRKAVENEDYETAALLRDRIQELEHTGEPRND